jgi:hypothetical protein
MAVFILLNTNPNPEWQSVLVFLVEAQIYDERVAPYELVQASPHYHGKPLLVCKECRASIEQNRLDLLRPIAHRHIMDLRKKPGKTAILSVTRFRKAQELPGAHI